MKNITSLSRWIYVVLLGIASAIIVLVISPSIINSELAKSWVNTISSLSFSALLGVNALAISLIFYILNKFLVFNLNQVKNIPIQLKYPPITLSILICILFLAFFTNPDTLLALSFIQKYYLTSILGVIGLVLVLLFWDLSTTRNSNGKHKKNTAITLPPWANKKSETADLYKWLITEEPIDDLQDDKFDRRIYSQRIANIISSKNQSHICIVGPFGIGKTSIWQCAKKIIAAKNYIFVPVDGWGRSEKTAPAQIIDEVIFTLANYIDCSAIRNIPKDYIEAIKGIDFSGSKLIGNLLSVHSRKSPSDLIKKLDEIVTTIDKKMIIVLEDFDRNSSSSTMDDVAALLDRLKNLKSVGFLLCIGPGEKSHILSRISSHREDILASSSKKSVNLIIDLMIQYANHLNFEIYGIDENFSNSISEAIDGITKTPREIKYALRRSFTAWENLAGEVNIYDLIAINVLRYSSPEALDYVISNFKKFQKGIPDSSIPEELKDSLLKLTPHTDENSIHSLIKMIFPTWNSISGIGVSSNLQRINGFQGRKYLKMIMEERANDYTDQFFIKDLRKISTDEKNSNGNELIAKIISSDDISKRYIEFVSELTEYHKPPVSALYFYEFLLARFELGKDFYCRDIKLDKPFEFTYLFKYFDNEEIVLNTFDALSKKNISFSLEFKEHFKINEEIFIKRLIKNISSKMKPDEFVKSLGKDDPNILNRIYNLTVKFQSLHFYYLEFLFNAFTQSPKNIFIFFGNIIDSHLTTPSLSTTEKNLWLKNIEGLIKNFESIDTSFVSTEESKSILSNINTLKNLY